MWSFMTPNVLSETRYHRTTQTQPILILMIVLYTFSEEAELNGSTGKKEMTWLGLLNGQHHPSAIWNVMLIRYGCSKVHRYILKK